ncbi:S8 family serine peptidase [Paraferrimonas sedimenticola]|uniref:Ig-like domain-containing protein n=1 Tax=Paraferrimonas sedimenticola TaxID=375674 RepID=A0AA37RVT4_9GAMM|nr:S8 family serine peptidase [Paraferrimonas sedimenticola]GLP96259.1 hypothetical protein GCM10007895_15650 [Paraferrimonas sedimenticola]
MTVKLSASLISLFFAQSLHASYVSSGTPEITKFEQHHKPSVVVREQGPTRFIVELESAPMMLQSTTQASAGNYAARLQQEQLAFEQRLSNRIPGSKVESRFSSLFNGMVVANSKLDPKALAAIEGVKAVYPERLYYEQMDASHQVINSPAIWDAVEGIDNAGDGIRVAIIDGGIRPENPMFSGDGFSRPTENMPDDDYCSSVDASFCNDKLIVARWYEPGFATCEFEYSSPLGYGGHGSHVAGTAVGNPVDITFAGVPVSLSGVAPKAYLMVYKALFQGTDCGQGVGTNIMLMQALEDAINDGADVINNSWGGSAGLDPAFSPYRSMFEAAEAAGIVVVSSAGNSGNAPQTIGCPGCVESGITVANSTTGRLFGNSITANGQEYVALQASNTQLSADLNGSLLAAQAIAPDNATACAAFTADTFTDTIALVSRGGCTFEEKANNVQAAGASAMLVHNNVGSAPFSMFMGAATLPSVMISRAAGEAVIAGLSEGRGNVSVDVSVSRVIEQEFSDLIAVSSSRGPNGDAAILKPDIAAPGSQILSAVSPDDDGVEYAQYTGTSMASPHVAGAAALMRQLHPDWSANDIKTALMTSAQFNGIKNDDGDSPATPFDMGAGRLDLAAAAATVLTFDKASMAAPICVGECSFTRTVFNKGAQSSSWNLSASVSDGSVRIEPQSLTLDAGGSAQFTVTLDTSLASDDTWVFGRVNLSSSQGLPNASLPMAVKAAQSTDSSLIGVEVLSADNTASTPIAIGNYLNNQRFDGPVEFSVAIPQGTEFTSSADVQINVTRGQTTETSVNETQGAVQWTGNLDLPVVELTKFTGTYPNLLAGGFSSPFPCSGGCDETSFTFSDLPEFRYMGESYSAITVSDNGLVVVGGGDTTGTFANQQLPEASAPNNVVAPFWSDFDLAGDAPDDTGGGSITAAVVSTEDGSTSWLAIEWNDAQLWNDASGDQYSFSVWFRLGDVEEVTLNYFAVPNLPADLTIGAEDKSGTAGTSYRYQGAGAAVAANDLLALTAIPGGSVTIDYQVRVTEFNSGSDDTLVTDEEVSASIDVLSNDSDGDTKVAKANASSGGQSAMAQGLVMIMPEGALGNVAIAEQPANGSATLNSDNTITYQPNQDFFGTDRFSYTSEDEQGNTGIPAWVNVTVNNINDVPTLSPTGATVNQGQSATLNANATDVDNDALTFSWSQVSGPSLAISATTEQVTVTPSDAGTYVYDVTANDGTVDSATAEVTLVVNQVQQQQQSGSSGGGGGAWGWLLSLTALMLWRRRYSH